MPSDYTFINDSYQILDGNERSQRHLVTDNSNKHGPTLIFTENIYFSNGIVITISERISVSRMLGIILSKVSDMNTLVDSL